MAYKLPLKNFNAELQFVVTVVSGVYAVLTTDSIVSFNSVAGLPEAQLPAVGSVSVGKLYIITDMTGSAASSNISISTADAALIDGNAAIAINTNYGSVQVYTNGTNWFTIGG